MAEFLLPVTNNRGQTRMEIVRTIDMTNDRSNFYRQIFTDRSNTFSINHRMRLFIFEHVRYVMNADIDEFVRLENFDEIIDANDLLATHNAGVVTSERELM